MSEFTDLFGEWGSDLGAAPVSVEVETRLGASGSGEMYAPAVTVEELPILYGSGTVRDAEGNERTSTATIYIDLDRADDADRFTLESRVTLPDGRRATVLQVSSPNVYGLFGFKVVNVS